MYFKRATFNGHKFSFSEEQRNLVRKFFDEAEIFDNTDSYECISDTVEGDLIKDDTDTHKFAIAVSPIAFALNKSKFYIFEESKSPSKNDEKTVNDRLNELWKTNANNVKSKELEEYIGSRDGNAIEYKQIKPWQMDVLEKILGNVDSNLDDFLNSNFNSSNEKEQSNTLDFIKTLIFTGKIFDTTRFKFYDGLLD